MARTSAPPGTRQQPGLCAHLRFELGKLPCARVASIDAFTWTYAPSVSTVLQPSSAPTITVLGTIELANARFRRFSPLPSTGANDALYRFTVDLYVERMALRLVQYEG